MPVHRFLAAMLGSTIPCVPESGTCPANLGTPSAYQPEQRGQLLLLLCCALVAACCLGGFLTYRLLVAKNAPPPRQDKRRSAASTDSPSAGQDEDLDSVGFLEAQGAADRLLPRQNSNSDSHATDGSVLQPQAAVRPLQVSSAHPCSKQDHMR